MTCELFRVALVGDDPVERAEAERHAEDCAACMDLLQADRELTLRIGEWKEGSPSPAPDLERRIAASIAGGTRSALSFRRKTAAVRPALWIAAAAAAVLLVAVTWLAPGFVSDRPQDDIETILARAEKTRLEYAGAIAELERSAEPVLARAGDPDLPADQAALLLSYRDHLAHLDAVIAEVQTFLEQHPGHSGGNTVLLAALTEKQEVLSQLLELRLGDRS